MRLSRIVNLSSLVNQTMKAYHLGRDLEVRRTLRMLLAKPHSSTLLQLLSNRNQLPPLLPVPTLSKQRQHSASLAARQSRPRQRLYLTSTPNLPIGQLPILLRTKSPLNSTSFHLKMGARLRSPMILLVSLAIKNLQKPPFLPHSRALKLVEIATALCLPRPLRLSIRKPLLDNHQ